MNEQQRDPEDLDAEVEDLEHKGEQVQGDIDEAKTDWESKKGDESVPGAVGDDDLGGETFPQEEDEGG
jgi:hypothetical protein